MAGIFISYRRGQSAGYAGRLADGLAQHFGKDQIFRDVEDISVGADFVDRIAQAVGACEALIVVISPGWLEVTDADGRRRLDDPDDFVRLEIQSALTRDVRVIPVLVGGAKMPKSDAMPEAIRPLARRQAVELSDTRWDFDVGRLVEALQRAGVRPGRRAARAAPSASRSQPAIKPAAGSSSKWKIGAGIAGAALVAVIALAAVLGRDSEPEFDTLLYEQDASLYPEGAPAISDQAAVEPTDVTDLGSGAETPDYGQPSSAGDVLAREQPALMEAVRRASEAETLAQGELDAEPLYGAFSGEALQTQLAALQQLTDAGEYAENELLNQRFLSFDLSPDGMFAEVRVIETWTSEHYSSYTGECLHEFPTYDAPQTVFLERSGGRWLVQSIVHDNAGPQPVYCQ